MVLIRDGTALSAGSRCSGGVANAVPRPLLRTKSCWAKQSCRCRKSEHRRMLPESSRIANHARNGRAQTITLRAAFQVISSSRAITRAMCAASHSNRGSACGVSPRCNSHRTRDRAIMIALVRRTSAAENHAALQRRCSVAYACVRRVHAHTTPRSVTLIDTVAIVDGRGWPPSLRRDRPPAGRHNSRTLLCAR
jgi:hypothetical protein